jgi:1-aminocyclopropane-1-carboxylate deaminase
MHTRIPPNGDKIAWLRALAPWPRFHLAQLPTPIQRAQNFGRHLSAGELWIKRDDLTGLAGGGNKTRKLEFLVGDALEQQSDTLVTVGALQSNHTRQTAAAAARAGLKCALLHCAWTRDAGPVYRLVGNLLLSSLMGAELYADAIVRPVEDQGGLAALGEHLRRKGQNPYIIPGGGSDHLLGGLGYVVCAAEIVAQAATLGISFDYVIHTTGSGSTQAGLLAGFAALNQSTRVIGISDDDETSIKRERVLRLANATLTEMGILERIAPTDVEIAVGDSSPYGTADDTTVNAIQLLARTEGLIADPVYEGKAIRGLIGLAKEGRFSAGSRTLLLHLGGTPAIHAYANRFGSIDLIPFQRVD